MMHNTVSYRDFRSNAELVLQCHLFEGDFFFSCLLSFVLLFFVLLLKVHK